MTRWCLCFGAGLCCLAATVAWPPMPMLVWNASASAPIGLYAVMVPIGLERGDMVVAHVPETMRGLAVRRHYLPVNVPLVKSVAAVAGDVVCAIGDRISVNGRLLVRRRPIDGHGRTMPWWTGCISLRGGAVFLIMKGHPDSFDGRYFGPTPARDIIGRARLLWAR